MRIEEAYRILINFDRHVATKSMQTCLAQKYKLPIFGTFLKLDFFFFNKLHCVMNFIILIKIYFFSNG